MVKLATPAALVVPDAGLMLSAEPRLEVRLTVRFAARLPWVSRRVTLTTATDVPLPGTEFVEMLRVEEEGLTAPATMAMGPRSVPLAPVTMPAISPLLARRKRWPPASGVASVGLTLNGVLPPNVTVQGAVARGPVGERTW